MADKTVKVKTVKMFRDKNNGSNWVGIGVIMDVSEARAKVLVDKKVAKLIEEKKDTIKP